MEDDVQMQIDRLKGRVIGLNVAVGALATAVAEDMEGVGKNFTAITSALAATMKRYTEPDDPTGQGVKDIEKLLRELDPRRAPDPSDQP